MIKAGSIPVRLTNPFNISARRLSGRMVASEPPTLPIGDVTASMITTYFIIIYAQLLRNQSFLIERVLTLDDDY